MCGECRLLLASGPMTGPFEDGDRELILSFCLLLVAFDMAIIQFFAVVPFPGLHSLSYPIVKTAEIIHQQLPFTFTHTHTLSLSHIHSTTCPSKPNSGPVIQEFSLTAPSSPKRIARTFARSCVKVSLDWNTEVMILLVSQMISFFSQILFLPRSPSHSVVHPRPSVRILLLPLVPENC